MNSKSAAPSTAASGASPVEFASAIRHPGYWLAVTATVLLVTDGILMLISTAFSLEFLWGPAHSLSDLMTNTPFPIVLYMIWGLGVFGSAGAICAIAVYGFRERWFWRWLVAAAAVWLISPPAHTIIGLISLIVLIRGQKNFPRRQSAAMPAT